MDIAQRIEEKLKESMREGDTTATGTLRMVKSALKNAEIAAQKALGEDQTIGVLQKEVKLRQDAAQSYTDAGRPELAEKEHSEISVIREFLPEAPSEEAIKAAVSEAVASTGATGMAQMGAVIGSAKAKLGAAADGAQIAAEAKRQLAG
jgi:hypothetical protein